MDANEEIPVETLKRLFFTDNGFGKKSLGVVVQQYIDASVKLGDLCKDSNALLHTSSNVRDRLVDFIEKNPNKAKEVLISYGFTEDKAKNLAYRDDCSLNNPCIVSQLSEKLTRDAIAKNKGDLISTIA